MKIDLKLVITLSVLAVIAAYVYFYEIRGEEERLELEERAKKILTLEKDDIQSLKVKNGNGLFLLEKVEGEEGEEEWMLRHPIETKADPSAVNDILWELEELEAERTLEGEMLDLHAYGLDPPKIDLEIGSGSGAKEFLRIGEKYRGSLLYLTGGGAEGVVLSRSDIDSNADLDLYGFRYKKLTDYDWDKLIGIDLDEAGKPRYKLRYEEGRWNLIAPVSEEASKDEIYDIRDTLQDLKALRFVSERPDNPAEYGLDKPAYRLTLLLEDGKTQTVAIGAKADYKGEEEHEGEEHLYARAGHGRPVVVISAKDLEKILVEPEALREKRICTVSRWDIKGLKVSHGGTAYELQKIEGNWFLGKDGQKKADEEKVDAILDALADLEFVRFINAPADPGKLGFTNPALRVAIIDEEGKSAQTFVVGKDLACGDRVALRRGKVAGEEAPEDESGEPSDSIEKSVY